MKAKVIERFRDKDTLKTYPLNSSYEGDEKRVKGLQGLGFLGESEKEELKEEPPKKEDPKQEQKEKKTASKKGR